MNQGVVQQRFSGKGHDGDAAPLSAGRPGGRGAQRSIKVLIADDDRDTVLSLRLLLATEGYEVLGVYDANAVFDGVRDFEPDAVLLDIGMPHMDGYELARRLRADPATSGALLFALTGYGQQKDREAAFSAGFARHFAKPVDLAQLVAALAESLAA